MERGQLDVTSSRPRTDAAASRPSGFPDGFLWGAATSAYQIEGATTTDGRGVSIWDSFSQRPGAIRAGHTGDVAADHYHRYRDDVALMVDLGLNAYRFSIAWPRIQPTGTGEPEQRGLDFYRRLVDELLDAEIEPWPTLYHWDLPQPLEDTGGWPARSTAEAFAQYAAIVHEALGDRVTNWTTLNEPWCAAFLGYADGQHAPGRTEPAAAVAAAHHLMLGHTLAADLLRTRRPDARVGIVLNLAAVAPHTDADADADAARRVDGLHNRLFLDAVLHGRYPDDVLDDLGPLVPDGLIRPGDLSAGTDFLGVNYYTRHTVSGALRPEAGPSPWVGSEHVRTVSAGLPVTRMGWDIDAGGLTGVLSRLSRDYPPVPLYVTENGAAFDDAVRGDGAIRDGDRVGYLDAHLAAARAAIGDGVPLRGYFVWSLLDNFEWAAGYELRFGLVYVDFVTQRRVLKDSAHWYANMIRRPVGLTDDSGQGRIKRMTTAHGKRPDARPTLEAVARHAGVSRGTVSRVINDSPRVSPQARSAVLSAIDALGYVPNQAARTLVTRRTGTVALIVSESQDRVFADPYFASILRCISTALADTDLQLLLSMAQSPAERTRLRRYLSGQHVDGAILLSLHVDDPLPDELQRTGLPLVLGGRPVNTEHVWYVDADNQDGARQATDHLLATGRRRVATITGPADMPVGIDRLAGYRDGLTSAGLAYDDTLVAAGDFSEESGACALRALVDRHPDIDAVFAASDTMALGAMRQLQQYGRRVPDDVAVIGFDDSDVARHTSPPLTTVHQPLNEMGTQLVESLLDLISGAQRTSSGIILPTHLITRDSA